MIRQIQTVPAASPAQRGVEQPAPSAVDGLDTLKMQRELIGLVHDLVEVAARQDLTIALLDDRVRIIEASASNQ